MTIIVDILKPALWNLLRSCKRNYTYKFKLESMQEDLLINNLSPNIDKLIVFLTPGYDVVNGGILSITSIYEETIKLKNIHGAEVIMCTIPGELPLLKYTKFYNDNYIYQLPQVIAYFSHVQDLIIHIPEYALANFLNYATYDMQFKLNSIKNIHFNIMLQNINIMIDQKHILELKKLGRVTITTAHERYSNLETSRRFGLPLHKFSTYLSPEQYKFKKYHEKENLLIVSPDVHPKKSNIIKLIQKKCPNLKIVIINKMAYEDYKDLISKAKWALTFGEGLDGYFVETIFSGGISFATYNRDFFTEDFKSLRTVYDTYETLARTICSDIMELDNEYAYVDYQKMQYNMCAKYYNYKEYKKNIELFYGGRYTYE